MSKVLDISKFTEVDIPGRLALNYTGVVATGMRADESVYCYKDFGANYLSSGYKISFTLVVSSTANDSDGVFAGVANNLGARETIDNGDGIIFEAYKVGAGNKSIELVEFDGGASYSSAAYVYTDTTTYYIDIVRDETVGTHGTVYYYIYTTAARTVLTASGSIALHTSKKDYRYFYAVASYSKAVAAAMTATISDITLTKFEDLTTYDKTDPNNRIVVSGDSVTGTSITRSEVAYVGKNIGANYFSGTFTIEQDIKNTTVSGSPRACFSVLSNSLGSPYDLDVAGGSLLMGYVDAGNYYLQEVDSGTIYDGAAIVGASGTQYYSKLVRTEDSGFGTATLYLYSNAARTTLVGSSSVSLHTSKKNFSHLSALATYNDTTAGACTTISSNLAIIENHKFEDFTSAGWAETDPNSRIVRTADTVTGTNISRNEVAYVARDYGVDHFNSNFYHQLEAKAYNVDVVAVLSPWAMWNGLGDLAGLYAASVQGLDIYFYRPGAGASLDLYVNEYVAFGTAYSADLTGLSQNVNYYIDMIRDELTGTYGTLYMKVYTNVQRTVLFGVSSIALHTSFKDFRYLYPMQSYHTSTAASGDLLVQNLDINEDAVVGGFLTRNYWWQRTHGNLIGV